MQELLVLHLQVRDGENDWLKYVLQNDKKYFSFFDGNRVPESSSAITSGIAGRMIAPTRWSVSSMKEMLIIIIVTFIIITYVIVTFVIVTFVIIIITVITIFVIILITIRFTRNRV